MTTDVVTTGTSRGAARVDSLDALRGVLALGVMVYHLVQFRSDLHLDALGTYAVYTFFILSGFAMTWVSADRAPDAFPIRDYAVARIARIAPLWWFAVLASVASELPDGPGVGRIVENLTFVGALTPTADIPLGGWSIEIEVVFYLLFPMMLTLVRGRRALVAFFVATLALRLLYVWSVWPSGERTAPPAYTFMPTFLAFFAGGMLVADWRRHQTTTSARWPAALGALLLVAVLGSGWHDGGSRTGLDLHTMLVGPMAAVLTVACVAAVAAVSLVPNPTSRWGRAIAETLGAISYGAYLLHPLVYLVVNRVAEKVGLGDVPVIGLTVVGTVVAAWCSHRFFEMPARRLIRRRLAPRPAPAA